jgi:hypothetical protein
LENKLEHAPFIRHIYSPIKDFTNAFVGNKKRFNRPVLVTTATVKRVSAIGGYATTAISPTAVMKLRIKGFLATGGIQIFTRVIDSHLQHEVIQVISFQ